MERIAIIGAGGYTGRELVSILLRHPGVQIAGLFGSDRGQAIRSIGQVHPSLRGLIDEPIRAGDVHAVLGCSPGTVLLGTPHQISAAIAGPIVDAGVRVIDLSGAFRLPAAMYGRWYGSEHPRPDLLGAAVYGLPEVSRAQIAGADLIAVAGCYPTSALIPLMPLIRAGAVRPGMRPIIDATSGVSGAGRGPSPRTGFCEVSFQPYNVLAHRHGPEIERVCGRSVLFTPSIGPWDRGILATIHVELEDGWGEVEVRSALEAALGDEAFVRLLPEGEFPSIAAVGGSNFCDVGVAVDNGHAVVFAAIDNLIKGAAGQAVQCLNLALGLPEQTGIIPEHSMTQDAVA